MPNISVIVPVYKVEKYLSRCIDSILNQTYKDFELVLIDDGSPDNCGKICDKYAEKDERVHVIHQINQGVSVARNVGIDWAMEKSDSKWITFIDSDDWVNRLYLETLLKACIENDVQISSCKSLATDKYVHIDNFQEIKTTVMDTEDFYFVNESLTRNSSCIKLYHKEAFENVRFPPNERFEDTSTTYKLLFKFNHIAVVDSELYYYFQRDDSFMHKKWTPQRLISMESVYRQVSFFKKISRSAYKKSITAYIHFLIGTMNQIKAMREQEYMKYYKKIRRRLKYSLIKYHIYPTKKNFFYYEYAFPSLNRLKQFKKMLKDRK